MSGVNVSGARVDAAAHICGGVIETLSVLLKNIRQKYQNAGNDWNDSKYQQLGDIVNECNLSIGKTLRELSGCFESLNAIRQSLIEYESIDLAGNISLTENNDSALFSTIGQTSSITDGERHRPIKNKEDGLRREAEVKSELNRLYPKNSGYDIIGEAYLRDKSGVIVRDNVSNEARRIDFVVNNEREIVDMIEVTSMTADKTEQINKERRIREAGGSYVRTYDGFLIRIPNNIQTRIIRRA